MKTFWGPKDISLTFTSAKGCLRVDRVYRLEFRLRWGSMMNKVKVTGRGMRYVRDVHLKVNTVKLDIKAALREEENEVPS